MGRQKQRTEPSANGISPTRLNDYRAEREKAQAVVIAVSMALRRAGAAPENCDGGYEVLER